MKQATYDPVLEVFRLKEQLERIEKTISMIIDGSLYIHFMKRDEVLNEFYSSKRDVLKAMDIYINEIESDLEKIS